MLISTKQEDKKKITRRNKQKKSVDRYGLNTREFIIQKTIDITNEEGMSVFRIDKLSSTLELSPGNITYHFAKKENLCHAIWVKFYMELSGIEILVNRLMDVKQAFLVVRSILNLIYKYRGVVLYRGGDVILLQRDNMGEYSFHKIVCRIITTMLTHLNNNGYVLQDGDIAFVENSMLVNIRFWINKEYLIIQTNKYQTIEGRLSENTIEVLYSLYPCFNKKGKCEFDSVCKKTIRT